MIISANNKGTMKTVEPGKHLSDGPVPEPHVEKIHFPAKVKEYS